MNCQVELAHLVSYSKSNYQAASAKVFKLHIKVQSAITDQPNKSMSDNATPGWGKYCIKINTMIFRQTQVLVIPGMESNIVKTTGGIEADTVVMEKGKIHIYSKIMLHGPLCQTKRNTQIVNPKILEAPLI